MPSAKSDYPTVRISPKVDLWLRQERKRTGFTKRQIIERLVADEIEMREDFDLPRPKRGSRAWRKRG